MAKLVLSSNGSMLHQYFIDKERLTIGRDPDNQVAIDDRAISRTHAAIATIGNDQILEDLQSSNGTFVNGKRVSRHILQHGDVIELGPFNLRYLNPKLAVEGHFEQTMLIEGLGDKLDEAKHESTIMPEPVSEPVARSVNVRFPKGSVKIMFGLRAPGVIALDRVVATFGKLGEELAVITRRPMGYFVTHVEGARYPRVNSESIGKDPRALQHRDVIEVADEKLEFLLDQNS